MEKEELVKKYGINLQKLEEEQVKLAKQLEIKDKIDFTIADKFGAFFNTFIKNKILSCAIICDKDYEIIDRAYAFEKVSFPYIAGFRAYREKWCDPKTKEVEVRHIPTGFMMIDQKVFQKMILAGVPEYSEYNDVDGLEYQYFDFFQTKVRMGKYESEGWGFCSLARELGFKIYLNTGIVNGHIGNYLYEAKL